MQSKLTFPCKVGKMSECSYKTYFKKLYPYLSSDDGMIYRKASEVSQRYQKYPWPWFLSLLYEQGSQVRPQTNTGHSGGNVHTRGLSTILPTEMSLGDQGPTGDSMQPGSGESSTERSVPHRDVLPAEIPLLWLFLSFQGPGQRPWQGIFSNW